MNEITLKQIEENIKFFTELEKLVTSKVVLYQAKEQDAKKIDNEILRKWMNLSNRAYAIFRRDISDYIRHTAKQTDLNFNQYSEIAGMRLLRVFTDIINAFEYISELLRMNSKKLNYQLKADNSALVNSLKNEWACADDKMKSDFLSFVHGGVKNQSKKRQAFLELDLITEDDNNFLQFAWDLRNSMHINFNAIKRIKYDLEDLDTGEVYPFDYKKGDGLTIEKHPKWIVIIVEKIIDIMTNIITDLDDLPIKKEIEDL